jgi:energy-coupling factor transporter ATP-binding protein EcfA2
MRNDMKNNELYAMKFVYNSLPGEGYDYNSISWEFEKEQNLNDIIIYDYINRYFQIKNNLINTIKNTLQDNYFIYNDNKIEISKTYHISTKEHTCGNWSYKNENKERPFYINEYKDSSEEYLKTYGYTFLEFLSKYFGIPKNAIVQETIRRFNIEFSYNDRYLLNYKPCHNLINSSDKKPDLNVLNTIYKNFPSHIQVENIFSYQNLDGSFAFHVGYIKDKNNITYKIPITLWRENKTYNPKEKFDILNSNLDSKLNLYNIQDLAKNNINVLIFEDEKQLYELNDKIQEIFPDKFTPTTWSGGMECTIEKTDWSIFENKNCLTLIITKNTKEGYKKSNKIHSNIIKSRHKHIGFIIIGNTTNDLEEEKFFKLLDNDFHMDYDEFCVDAFDKFKLKFQKADKIEIYTGRQLLDLPSEEVEPVLAPLINKGNRVMICGSRGTGKSWLAMIIAAAIASGEKLFTNYDIFFAEKPKKVLYLDGEMSIVEEKIRVSKIFATFTNKNKGLENIKIINATQNNEIFLFRDMKDIDIIKKEINWADVVIIDSVFFFFPDAMGSQFEGARTLNKFLVKNSAKNITTIIIDHTGKSQSDHAYGTIGKEITLDLIIKLTSSKNGEVDFKIIKSRNHEINESNNKLKYKLITNDNNAKLIICENKNITDDGKNIKDNGKSSNNTKIEKIIKYYTDNPGTSIGKASIVLEIPYSTLGSNLKKLYSEGIMQKKGKHYFVKK